MDRVHLPHRTGELRREFHEPAMLCADEHDETTFAVRGPDLSAVLPLKSHQSWAATIEPGVLA